MRKLRPEGGWNGEVKEGAGGTQGEREEEWEEDGWGMGGGWRC